jgi:hypothetical protein
VRERTNKRKTDVTWKTNEAMDAIVELLENGVPLIRCAAAANIGCHPKVPQRWIQEDPVFAERCRVARRIARGMAELWDGGAEERVTWDKVQNRIKPRQGSKAEAFEREQAALMQQHERIRKLGEQVYGSQNPAPVNPAPAAPQQRPRIDRIAVPLHNINSSYYFPASNREDPPEFTGRTHEQRADGHENLQRPQQQIPAAPRVIDSSGEGIGRGNVRPGGVKVC